MQAFLTIFKWIILNRWIHKHLIWSCNLRDFDFKRYKQPFSGLYTSANSDLHMMTKRIPFLQQNFPSTLWNVYFLTFVVLNFKLYSLIFHFIKVSCTGTTSLLKCKIHTIHFQISFPLSFWTIKNIKSFTHHMHLLIHMYNTRTNTKKNHVSSYPHENIHIGKILHNITFSCTWQGFAIFISLEK